MHARSLQPFQKVIFLSQIEIDKHFMRMALSEAYKGLGRTSPNPCVGSVVVKNGMVVGRGYHHKAGLPHAEVNALQAAGAEAAGSTVYVTLEPCNHTGKTPPCSMALLEAGVSRVVVACRDENPLAVGGCEYLSQNGVEVLTGVEEEACRILLAPFLKRVKDGVPWVVMKGGMSLDGRISYCRGKGGKITGAVSGAVTHMLRDRIDAILVGIDTVLIDNPSLTARADKRFMVEGRDNIKVDELKSPFIPEAIFGPAVLDRDNYKDPIRVILDSKLRCPVKAKLLQQDSEADTFIFCGADADISKEQKLEQAGAVIFRVGTDADGHLDLHEVLSVLSENVINSILVEGGSRVHGSLMWQNLVDEFFLFVAPFFIGTQGQPLIGFSEGENIAESLSFARLSSFSLGEDILLHGLYRNLS